MTSPEHPECNESTHCRISESNGNFEVTFKPINDKWGHKLKSVQIRDLQTGAVQDFKMDAISSIDIKDHFKLFKIKFRPESSDYDLAIHAYNTAQGGSANYYFVYNKLAKKFVMSDEPLPQLIYEPKTHSYTSRYLSVKYVLTPEFKLRKK